MNERMSNKNNLLVSIGSTIQGLRRKQGYTQESFTEKIGMDVTYFGKVEQGIINIATLNLDKILNGLNIHFSEFWLHVEKKTYIKRPTVDADSMLTKNAP